MKQTIISQMIDFAKTDPANRLPYPHEYMIFDPPIVGVARGDDPLFEEYKSIIDPSYLTPREIYAESNGKPVDASPPALSVISWVLPVREDTRTSNRSENAEPSKFWAHTRWYGEKFNNKMREFVVGVLRNEGFWAVAPMHQPSFRVSANEKGIFSTWSERHTAYAAGLGTFSLSDGFITERGIAHRCGSVITDCILEPDARTKGTYDNCLFYADGSCSDCVPRCPAGAITGKGHDKARCESYQKGEISYVKLKYGVETPGCGLCQTGVPCEYENPVKES